MSSHGCRARQTVGKKEGLRWGVIQSRTNRGTACSIGECYLGTVYAHHWANHSCLLPICIHPMESPTLTLLARCNDPFQTASAEPGRSPVIFIFYNACMSGKNMKNSKNKLEVVHLIDTYISINLQLLVIPYTCPPLSSCSAQQTCSIGLMVGQ